MRYLQIQPSPRYDFTSAKRFVVRHTESSLAQYGVEVGTVVFQTIVDASLFTFSRSGAEALRQSAATYILIELFKKVVPGAWAILQGLLTHDQS